LHLLLLLAQLQTPAAQLVHLFADLAAVFASHKQLLADTQQLLLIQQEQLQSSAAAAQDEEEAAEVAALQTALQTSSTHLQDIYQDQLLAGELSAVAGYWLIRKLLPTVAKQLLDAAAPAAAGDVPLSPATAQNLAGQADSSNDAVSVVLTGLLALPGLRYQV
jgi:hypothetical protein